MASGFHLSFVISTQWNGKNECCKKPSMWVFVVVLFLVIVTYLIKPTAFTLLVYCLSFSSEVIPAVWSVDLSPPSD